MAPNGVRVENWARLLDPVLYTTGPRLGGRAARGVASVGLEFPLFGRAESLFLTLHTEGRFSDGSAAGALSDGPAERAAFVTVGLAWHEMAVLGLLK